jgi:hypothetical protein
MPPRQVVSRGVGGPWQGATSASPKVAESQHPLHPCGMKPTLSRGDDLEEQDLLHGGEL